MINVLPDMPDGVLGFEVEGKLHSDDYKNVLIPAIKERLDAGEKVRVVLVFPQWDGMAADAMWEDLKMGVEHLTHWKKIAIVTDVDWMSHLSKMFGWMTPGEMKTFPLAERDAAAAWAAAD